MRMWNFFLKKFFNNLLKLFVSLSVFGQHIFVWVGAWRQELGNGSYFFSYDLFSKHVFML